MIGSNQTARGSRKRFNNGLVPTIIKEEDIDVNSGRKHNKYS